MTVAGGAAALPPHCAAQAAHAPHCVWAVTPGLVGTADASCTSEASLACADRVRGGLGCGHAAYAGAGAARCLGESRAKGDAGSNGPFSPAFD